MWPIHVAHFDKTRPVVVLTRATVRPHLSRVTVAPITSIVRGLSTEVNVDERNGLDGPCVVSRDNITTVSTDRLGRPIGFLFDEQERALTLAIRLAFDLDD